MRIELAKIQPVLHADDASRLEDFKMRLYIET
jgi:hypothetical protein